MGPLDPDLKPVSNRIKGVLEHFYPDTILLKPLDQDSMTVWTLRSGSKALLERLDTDTRILASLDPGPRLVWNI